MAALLRYGTVQYGNGTGNRGSAVRTNAVGETPCAAVGREHAASPTPLAQMLDTSECMRALVLDRGECAAKLAATGCKLAKLVIYIIVDVGCWY